MNIYHDRRNFCCKVVLMWRKREEPWSTEIRTKLCKLWVVFSLGEMEDTCNPLQCNPMYWCSFPVHYHVESCSRMKIGEQYSCPYYYEDLRSLMDKWRWDLSLNRVGFFQYLELKRIVLKIRFKASWSVVLNRAPFSPCLVLPRLFTGNFLNVTEYQNFTSCWGNGYTLSSCSPCWAAEIWKGVVDNDIDWCWDLNNLLWGVGADFIDLSGKRYGEI